MLQKMVYFYTSCNKFVTNWDKKIIFMKRFNNKLIKISAIVLSACLAMSVNANAASMIESLPVAGAAKKLNEGLSITSLQADQIKKTAAGASLAMVASENTQSIVINKGASTIVEAEKNTDPAIITVGAASTAVVEAEEVETSDDENITIVVSDNDAEDTTEAESTVAEGTADATTEEAEESEENEEISDADLVDAVTRNRNYEEEDFTNLVIAQVNDYVNVRSGPGEDYEIVGKLYNKSVGDLLEDAGEWYKIKSGNCTGYVKGEFVVTGEAAVELAKEVGTRMARVTTTTLYVRSEPSTDCDVIGMVPMDDELTVSEELDGWAKVSVEEGDGYVSTEFVKLYTDFVRAESKEEEEIRLAKEKAAREAAREAARKAAAKNGKKQSSKGTSGGSVSYAPAGSGTGSNVANFALQFVGNPYVYGGSSLTNGTDCSGFVMSVYRNFGVSLPHSSGGDRSVGYDVGGLGNAQPGDIVCYSGHVGIYIGGGQIVHASTARTGIKVSSANYRNVLAVRRIF